MNSVGRDANRMAAYLVCLISKQQSIHESDTVNDLIPKIT